jgi:adenylate cyclase
MTDSTVAGGANQRHPWRVRYRVGLGATVSLLLAITLLALATATYVNTYEAIVQLAHDRARDLLAQTGVRIQSHMLAAVPSVELSRMLVRDKLLPTDREALSRHFILVLRANPSFSWVSYSDAAGSFTGAYRAQDGTLRVSHTRLRSGRSELTEHTVDDSGTWTPFQRKTDYGYDPRRDRFYEAAQSAGRRVWVGPYVFFDEGVPGMTCAVPHFAPDGRLLGVFTVDFNLNALSRFVAGLSFGRHGRVVILTPDGTVIAHPTLKVVEVTGQKSEGKLLRAPDVADRMLQAFAAAARTHEGAQTLLAGDGAEEFTFIRENERYLAAIRRVEIDDGLTWIVGAFAPEDDFLDVLERNHLVAITVAATALCFGMLATFVLARRISVPLTRLASEMEEAGAFNLTARLPQRTIFKEVALMDEALLRMKGSLRSFAYYVPTDLVRTMLASGQEATLSGHRRELTVYFSDIAGFTAKAETMSPDALVSAMSRYLEAMTRIIAAHGGTVDKFIGDAIMAFWGAPAPVADHAARACETAIHCQRALARIRANPGTPWEASQHARIGIATGDVVVGNMGSPERFNYTVMGDTVNLASRLEGLNKLYGTSILVTEATYDAARGRVIGRPVDLVQVQGRSRGVKVYELLGLAGEDEDGVAALAATAAEAFDAYVAGEFGRAAAGFETMLERQPQDRVAALLAERCREFMATPPPADWAGVYVATQK